MVLFFDLFYTLINLNTKRQYDYLNVSKMEFEKRLSQNYSKRMVSNDLDKMDIINLIVEDFNLSEKQKEAFLEIHLDDLKKAYESVDFNDINVLKELKERGHKLCLVSNCDKLDIEYYENSILSNIFDEKIFSCLVGVMKPDEEIYQLALEKMSATAKDCIFIGDGGDKELIGAKNVGMKVIKMNKYRQREMHISYDYEVDGFKELLKLIDYLEER